MAALVLLSPLILYWTLFKYNSFSNRSLVQVPFPSPPSVLYFTRYSSSVLRSYGRRIPHHTLPGCWGPMEDIFHMTPFQCAKILWKTYSHDTLPVCCGPMEDIFHMTLFQCDEVLYIYYLVNFLCFICSSCIIINCWSSHKDRIQAKQYEYRYSWWVGLNNLIIYNII